MDRPDHSYPCVDETSGHELPSEPTTALVCDETPNGSLRDFSPFMRVPVYSISARAAARNPERLITNFNRGNVLLTVKPDDGISAVATVRDNDLMIYAISVLRLARKKGKPHGPTVTFKPGELLTTIERRVIPGRIKDLRGSLRRLRNTRVEYTELKGKTDRTLLPPFASTLITAYTLGPHDELDSRAMDPDAVWSLTVADWLHDRVMLDGKKSNDGRSNDKRHWKIIEPSLLKLGLRSLELAVARLATVEFRIERADGGGAVIPVDYVRERSGSKMERAAFERSLGDIVKRNRLPDHELHWEVHPWLRDCIVVRPRDKARETVSKPTGGAPTPVHPKSSQRSGANDFDINSDELARINAELLSKLPAPSNEINLDDLISEEEKRRIMDELIAKGSNEVGEISLDDDDLNPMNGSASGPDSPGSEPGEI